MRKTLAIWMMVIVSAPASAQEVTTYTYDALGRLRETNTTGGPNDKVQVKADFDPAGNRSSYRVTGSPAPGTLARRVIVVPLNGFTVIPLPNQ